ncbi:MAG TPA: PLP-dependent aminotransferase family protein [Trebonia sp.]
MRRANQRAIGMRLPMELGAALEGWRRGEGPLRLRLAAALAAAVERRDLLPGTKLPPERVLAAQLGVARTTVSAAYELLEQRGLVDRLQGRGTHVTCGDGTPVGQRAADLTTSLQRNVIFRRLTEGSPDAIDLLGSSAPPGAAIRQAVTMAAGEIDLDELMTDHGYYPLGYPPLRRAIAAHLSARGLPTTQEQILVTGGAQQAISLLAAYYVSPGSVIVLEDPTFPGAVDAFRAAGARILTVPLLAAGAGIDLIAATISQGTVRAVYLMPTFHNPTGAVMPEAVRRELARLARASEIPIIDDNTLVELALGSEPPPPLAAYGRDAPIVSIGSLSKLFWAGLRVGWIRASRSVIAQLGPLKAVADLGCSLVSQAIAAGMLADVDRIGDLRRAELTERLALLEDLLHDMLPDWRWRQPKGGPSIWARLPAGSSAELAQVAGRHGVLIAPGPLMSPTGRFDEFVRLPFDHEPAVLREGVRRLASAWDSYAAALDSYGSSRMDVIV